MNIIKQCSLQANREEMVVLITNNDIKHNFQPTYK